MYKKLTENEDDFSLFHNYYLTELMVLKKKGREVKYNQNPVLSILLRQKLEEYGLTLFGFGEYGDLALRSVRLLDGFPIENEDIIKQLYGYSNLTVNINLKAFDEFAVAFNYNVDTGGCELLRYSFGTTTHRIKFDTFCEMMTHLNTKGYEAAFIDEV